MYNWEDKFIKKIHEIRNSEQTLLKKYNNLIILLFTISLSAGLVASAFTVLILHQFSDTKLTTGQIFSTVMLLDQIRFDIVTQSTVGISALINIKIAIIRLKEILETNNDMMLNLDSDFKFDKDQQIELINSVDKPAKGF